MIILQDAYHLSNFLAKTKLHIVRLNKTRQPAMLMENGREKVVVMSARAFRKLHREYDEATLQQSIYETDLELFRIGKISAEEFRRAIRPNPKALGVPLDVAFAELRRRAMARCAKKAK